MIPLAGLTSLIGCSIAAAVIVLACAAAFVLLEHLADRRQREAERPWRHEWPVFMSTDKTSPRRVERPGS